MKYLLTLWHGITNITTSNLHILLNFFPMEFGMLQNDTEAIMAEERHDANERGCNASVQGSIPMDWR